MTVIKTKHTSGSAVTRYHMQVVKSLREHGYLGTDESLEWVESAIDSTGLIIGKEQISEISSFRPFADGEKIVFLTRDAGDGIKFYTMDIRSIINYNNYNLHFETYLIVDSEADAVALRLKGII